MVGIAPIGITRVVSAERLRKTSLYKTLNATAASERVLKDGSIAVAIYKGASKLASKFLVFKKGTDLDGDINKIWFNLRYSKEYFTKKKKKEGIIEKTIEKMTYKEPTLVQESDSNLEFCMMLEQESGKEIKRFFNKKNELLAAIEYSHNPQYSVKRKTTTAEGLKDAQKKLCRTIREYMRSDNSGEYEFKEYANGRRVYERDSVKEGIRYVFDTVKGFFVKPSRYKTKDLEVKDSLTVKEQKDITAQILDFMIKFKKQSKNLPS